MRAAAGRSSRSMSARPRPRRSGPRSSAAWSPRPGRRPARDHRRARRPEGSDREGPRLRRQRCTVHLLRDCFGHAARSARPVGRVDPPDLRRRLARAGARAALRAVAHLDGRLRRSGRCSKRPSTTSSPSTRSQRRAGASCVDETARADQQRGQPAHRRRRHLRRRPDAAPHCGMLCIEQNDEWLSARLLSAESISMCLADPEKS